MAKKPLSAAMAISCAAVMLYAAAPTYAGEVNGNGDPIPATDHAASACAFSGLNDNPVDPPPGDFPGRVQSFGSLLKFLAELLGFRLHPLDADTWPGEACRGNVDFLG